MHDPSKHGPAYARYLADTLTDLEFELLLRHRCEAMSKSVMARDPELTESHTSFSFHWTPQGRENGWRTSIGVNYNLSEDSKGEVLSTCITNALTSLQMRQGNKISLLLGHDSKAE